MSSIKHYLSVYKKFIETSFSVQLSFRTSFALLIFMDLFFYISTLATVDFIYDHVAVIGPWEKNKLMFFISFMLCVDHLHMTLLSESFWVLSRQIRTGELDFILLKPVHSIFTIFFRYIRPSSLTNTIAAWGFLIYFGSKVPLTTTAWLILPILLIMAFILLAIIEIIISTAMFWLTEGLGINFLRMQIQSLARWPDYIYKVLARRLFTVLMPILLIGSAPVRFMLDLKSWDYIAGMIAAIFVFGFLMFKIWSRALIRYESASS
ncbi:MAG: ABC-2 family transporter protein [Bacteriovoracaceae bacterium]|nr:ABC-2 family transporter protein [Bacteriovoracaceae bacterium]